MIDGLIACLLKNYKKTGLNELLTICLKSIAHYKSKAKQKYIPMFHFPLTKKKKQFA